MFCKTKITVDAHISFERNTKVKFDDKEFFIVPESVKTPVLPDDPHNHRGEKRYILHVKNIKGDFEIQLATFKQRFYNSYQESSSGTRYDSFEQKFDEIRSYNNFSADFKFTILTDVKYKKVESKETQVSVVYRFWVSAKRMQALKRYEYCEDIISLPGYEWLKFKYSIKKINDKDVEIIIENPFKVRIEFFGQIRVSSNSPSPDYTDEIKIETNHNKDVNEQLLFIFAPNELQPRVINSASSHKHSTNPTNYFSKPTSDLKLLRTKYTDTVLISSDGKQFPCHRCVLAKHSHAFDNAFEQCDQIPAKINFSNFDGKTVSAFLDFCYGDQTTVAGNCNELIKLADKLNVQELKDACCYYCNEKVDPTNVCEVIQIAYSNNLEELKQKCKQIMIEKKAEIDQGKLKALPKVHNREILVTNKDVFYPPMPACYIYDLYIKAKVNLQEVVTYNLQIDYKSFMALKPFQFFVQNITFPEHGNFKCYIKKSDESFVEIHVANPNRITINDQTEDYHCIIKPQEFMVVTLTFIFT